MQLTVKAKIMPTKEQEVLLSETLKEYIGAVNDLVSSMIQEEECFKLTSKDVNAELPSALRCQAIQDARSVFKKYRKTKIHSVLKKTLAIIWIPFP